MVSSLILAAVFAKPMPFKLCVQAWTFHEFSAFQAIEKAAAAGSDHIELFPGQKLKDGGDASVGPWMSASDQAALTQQLNKFKVKAIAFGVTGIEKDAAKAKPLFEWAKSMGIEILNTESTESIDTIEAMVKEYNIKVGFHNHPKQPNNPKYVIWDPNYVYNLVKNRDKRIGACADTGHWVRSGIKPTDALNILKGRVVSSHLKDLHEFTPGGHDMPYGQGVSDIVGILGIYNKINMTGSVSVEYEYNWQTNVPEVAQCLGFVRGHYSH
jgi:sugar phosphate isomerase/epimerase